MFPLASAMGRRLALFTTPRPMSLCAGRARSLRWARSACSPARSRLSSVTQVFVNPPRAGGGRGSTTRAPRSQRCRTTRLPAHRRRRRYSERLARMRVEGYCDHQVGCDDIRLVEGDASVLWRCMSLRGRFLDFYLELCRTSVRMVQDGELQCYSIVDCRCSHFQFMADETEHDDAIEVDKRAEAAQGIYRSFDDSLVPIVTERGRSASERSASWTPDSRLVTRLICPGRLWHAPL